ncbi:MAG: NACHT domain-containing protein [Blastocatellia bacterium]|nr:NACHT domain-containing protein [Blastocatellia bacterium]
MPIDWLFVWGVAQTAGFLFKPVLESLAVEAGKDIAKDKIKESFGSLFRAVGKDALTRAYGKAVKELLLLIQDELIVNDVPEAQVEAWNDDVELFVRSEGVQETFRRAFGESSSPVDAGLLAQSWQRMTDGPHILPAGFNWSRIAKLFGQKVRKIREEEKELRDALKAQAVIETAGAVQNRAGIAPDFDLEKYREAMLEMHQHLKLELLDHTGASYKIQLRSVFVPQTVRDCQEFIPQVFEIPKEHLQRLRKAGALDEELLDLAEGMQEEMVEVRRRSYLDQSPRSVLEIVGDDRLPHLVILGSPGSGKSTLLKALVLEWAQEPDATARAARPVPLFIELREYDRWNRSDGKSFVRFLHEAQVTCRLNQQRLDEVLRRRGGAMLLLDGLDEIFDRNRRNDAINDIHRFSNDYPDTPVIVTSRIIGYKQRRLSDANFRHFMLQDLDDAQIEEFLDRWHRTFVPESRERDAKRHRIIRAIGESHAIRELADNPLLLTLMSMLNLHQELPRDRVQLYERASQVLLHQWDVERLGLEVTIDYKEKAEMLRRLASFLQSGPGGLKGNIIAGEDLERLLRDYFRQEMEHPDPRNAAREMVRQLRERNYILCLLGEENFAFVHRTMLEYFCASAFVRQSLREESSLDFLKRQVFAAHWRDESWREVLRLIAGMDEQVPVEHVAKIVDFLLEEKDESHESRNIFLAADCCLEVRNPRSLGRSRARVTDALLRLVRFDFPYFYEEREYEVVRRRNEIRAKAVRALANPQLFDQARSWIEERCRSDQDWVVRQAAVGELARGWKDDADTLPLLKDRAARDESPAAGVEEWLGGVRNAAIEAIFRGWPDDPGTLDLLRERAKNGPTPWLREKAKRWADQIEARR